MTPKEFEISCADARKRVAGFDGIDGHKDRDPKTVYSALKAGLISPRSNAQFDALVMLEDVVNMQRTNK